MTEEKILEYAKEYLDVFPDDVIATKEQLIKFAQRIYQMGRYDGYDEGYKVGSTGIFGEPLR